MTSRLQNIVNRFLKENDFEIDGFKYKFFSVGIEDRKENPIFHIGFDVTLPNKDQSYAVQRFIIGLQEILENLSRYLGITFAFSPDITINGKEPKEVYMNPNRQKEILDRLNSELQSIELDKKTGFYSFDIVYRPAKRFFYKNGQDLEISFNLSITGLSKDGRMYNPKDIRDFGSILLNSLYDDDDFATGVEDIIFDVLEPDLKLSNINDLFYKAHFNIEEINGRKISK